VSVRLNSKLPKPLLKLLPLKSQKVRKLPQFLSSTTNPTSSKNASTPLSRRIKTTKLPLLKNWNIRKPRI